MTEPCEATIYLVEDDDDMRQSLICLLRQHAWRVEAFATADALREAYDPEVPGCLVVDLQLPHTDGLSLQRSLARIGSIRPFIVITGHGDVNSAVAAMREGALDFVEKPFDSARLVERIREAIALDAERRAIRHQRDKIQRRIDSLTAREKQVMERVVAGMPTREIARELGISPKTVEVHRANVTRKMAVDSVTQLLRTVIWHNQHTSSGVLDNAPDTGKP